LVFVKKCNVDIIITKDVPIVRELPNRKPNRLRNYDYSQRGIYYVTICTKDRAELFGTVGATVPGRPNVELSDMGNIVHEAILHNANNNDVVIDHYVIMPNHIHMLIVICPKTGDRGRSPLQTIIRNMKAYVTKQIGFSPWQKSFNDHIVRNDDEYRIIAEYIDNNPARWLEDCFHQ
jgi:REP element-mobilizing transposase RayT